MKRSIGVCYYPEQWPEIHWENDIRKMKSLGISWIRIGEFSWSQIEPKPYHYDFNLLDQIIEIIGRYELKVVLGTPTAAPPAWLIDLYPGMLPMDQFGVIRQFGSRRHYNFCSEDFIIHCEALVRKLAKRYGKNPHLGAWQIDNEYGCHDTVTSYDPETLKTYQKWLEKKFSSKLPQTIKPIDKLNKSWGNDFWSMNYMSFDQIGFPINSVTEPNPSHLASFLMFASDRVRKFNSRQVKIIKHYSDYPVTHNFMGKVIDFDHFKIGQDLDFASWDSYPLGFLEDRVTSSQAHKKSFSRQGDPDFQAFHHDLYRAVGNNRWWVMEQQPGGVNWAPYNPTPFPGAVRLWTWEAFAHGAEVVSFFRWRQARSGQEQLHSGLLSPFGMEMPVLEEIREVISELKSAPNVSISNSEIGVIFDYQAALNWKVQPHGKDNNYFDLVFDFYRCLRKLGQSIDFISPNNSNLNRYKVIIIPGAMHMDDQLICKLRKYSQTILLGPRSACRDENLNLTEVTSFFPDFDLRIMASETFRADSPVRLENGGFFVKYRELIVTQEKVLLKTESGDPALIECGKIKYLAGWPDESCLFKILKELFKEESLSFKVMPEGVRERRSGSETFLLNYNDFSVSFDGVFIPPAGVVRQKVKKV